MTPSSPGLNLPSQEVWIPVPETKDRIHAWWIPAPKVTDGFIVLPNEPVNILKSPKTMLYFYGVGRNKGDYNYLARVAGFHQLGFSVLMFDYRGYGRSEGRYPRELQLYEDSQSVWDYLRYVQKIPSEDIIIYGESLGGAIALDLARNHSEAKGLIMQSSFTSMAEVIKRKPLFQFFPVDFLLTEKFDSLSKIGYLQMPVLFLHGTSDPVVPSDMSKTLYNATSERKQLFWINGAEHVKIYKSGQQSYLKAVQRFMKSLD
jgi:uncharacterized protein